MCLIPDTVSEGGIEIQLHVHDIKHNRFDDPLKVVWYIILLGVLDII